MSKRETISNLAQEFVTDPFEGRAGDEPTSRWAIAILGLSAIATLVWDVWIVSQVFS